MKIYTFGIDDSFNSLIEYFFGNSAEICPCEDNGLNQIQDNVILISSNLSEKERMGIIARYNIKSFKNIFIFRNNAACGINKENIEFYNVLSPLSLNNIIDTLQIPIALGCNLKCNRCYHFSNIVQGNQIYEFDQYKADLISLVKLGVIINEFRFLGGEPFLNQSLIDYIHFAKKLFPFSTMKIITNGSLIPKCCTSLLNKLVETGVIISISLYPPLFNSIDAIKEVLQRINAKYEIFRIGDNFDKILYMDKHSAAEVVANNCEKCIIIYNGLIGRCAPGMFVNIFNDTFCTDYPESNSKPIHQFNSASELNDYLNKCTPLCSFCTGDNKIETYKWSITPHKPILEDYIINNKK